MAAADVAVIMHPNDAKIIVASAALTVTAIALGLLLLA
jgi:hypothetical protein